MTPRPATSRAAGPGPALSVRRDQALAWRLSRQHLTHLDGAGAVDVAQRLCGIQAQVPSAAALAVAVRQARPDPGATARALAGRSLVRTWAMRGTLHLLPVAETADVLSLLASARTWEKGSWQRTFVTVAQLEALAAAVTEALADGSALTRDELVERVLAVTGDEGLATHLRSGWSAVLKPLAWQGLVCQGPSTGTRVTFARPDRLVPDWAGLPEADEAAGRVIERYLGAFGPATPEAFDQWLLRGATSRPRLRRWFDALGDRLTAVDVEGRTGYVRAEDADELAATRPRPVVRLLPGFDQYVLGPGTADEQVVPAGHRAQVSRAAGWIAPVVVQDGRVVGTWSEVDGRPEIDFFAPRPGPEPDPMLVAAEVDRVAALLGPA